MINVDHLPDDTRGWLSANQTDKLSDVVRDGLREKESAVVKMRGDGVWSGGWDGGVSKA